MMALFCERMRGMRTILIALALLLVVPPPAWCSPEADSGPSAEYAGQDPEHWFGVIFGLPPAGLTALDGQRFMFAVDLANSPGFSLEIDAAAGQARMLYRMAFNNIAEGWSWDPLASPDSADYYRFKFLPLKSVFEEKAAPREIELYPGKTLEVRNLWRYDYFLAFENLYDFYPRQVNDDAGFSASVKMAGEKLEKEHVGMLALGRLKPPYHSESNTFWKADFADPVDYTLRKRYFIVELQEIRFFDIASGKVLASLRATPR